MQNVKKSLFCVLLAGIAGPAFGQGTGPLAVEDRSVASAQSAPGGATDDGVMLLMQQIQQYEQELSELRGVVEQMRHEMEQMREASRERYLDLDGRINAVAGAGAVSGTPGAGGDSSSGDAASTGSDTPSATAANDEKADRKAYMAARDLLLDRKFTEAGAAFNTYLEDYPGGQFRDWSWFWLGKIALSRATPDNDAARKAFETVISDYPESTKVPSAMYQLAILEANAGEPARARVTLNKLVKQFPQSSEAPLARDMLEQLK